MSIRTVATMKVHDYDQMTEAVQQVRSIVDGLDGILTWEVHGNREAGVFYAYEVFKGPHCLRDGRHRGRFEAPRVAGDLRA